MQYDITTEKNYRLGSITRNGERIFYTKISIDFHTKHSTKENAIEKVYAQMLLAGCATYTRETFLQALNKLGASLSVQCSNSTLIIEIQSSTDVASKVLTLFEKMIASPRFLHSELQRIKKTQCNALEHQKENARAIAHNTLVNSLYIQTDRRQNDTPDLLLVATKKVSVSDVKKLHQEVIANFWTITCGSNKETVSKLQKSIQKLTTHTIVPHKQQAHGQSEHVKKVLCTEIPGKQNIEFSIGTTIPMTLHHPHYLPFVFGISVLGKWGGFAGRLMSTVREKEGLTYGIYARTESVAGNEQGHWFIMTFFSPQQAMQGLRSTFREIKKIYKNGITDDEYKRFKTILSAQQTLLADSLTKSVDELHSYSAEGFSLNEMEHFKASLLAVTKKDVNTALKKYLHPTAISISAAGPVHSIKKQLLTTYSGK